MNEAPKDAFPLTWPDGQPRTPTSTRSHGRFEVTFHQAVRDLIDELRKLGARDVILSTNLPLRRDGLPYADYREPSDSGAAVYFNRKGVAYAMACDRYNKVHANIRGLGLTIEALRAIERHGSTSMLEQAFRGFAALPPPRTGEAPWWEVLEVPASATIDEAREARDRLAMRHHPDRGGTHEAMARINRAFETALERVQP